MRGMADEVGFGIIGAGNIAQLHAQGAQHLMRGLALGAALIGGGALGCSEAPSCPTIVDVALTTKN